MSIKCFENSQSIPTNKLTASHSKFFNSKFWNFYKFFNYVTPGFYEKYLYFTNIYIHVIIWGLKWKLITSSSILAQNETGTGKKLISVGRGEDGGLIFAQFF